MRRELGDHPNLLYYLGRLNLMDQKFPDAIRNLTEAMAQPPFADTAYHLGFAHLKQGDFASAEKWLKIAAQSDPADSAVPYQLALVYRKQRRGLRMTRRFPYTESGWSWSRNTLNSARAGTLSGIPGFPWTRWYTHF